MFNFDVNNIIECTTNLVEMTFYSLIQQNSSEHRKNVQDKFKRWINLAIQHGSFIKWVQDNFNEDDNIGLGW